tara:strand:+ start:84 stop:308 length:225 start_codon:yes stop_codon:yes gene_type:complete
MIGHLEDSPSVALGLALLIPGEAAFFLNELGRSLELFHVNVYGSLLWALVASSLIPKLFLAIALRRLAKLENSD